jgi:YD repeat-containing protein
MIKKLCIGVFLLVIALVWGLPASGQSVTTCNVRVFCGEYSLYYAQCVPPIPPGATDCSPIAFGMSCLVTLTGPQCSAPTNWCTHCGKGVPGAGSPINLTNGNTYIDEVDVKVPGLGGGLALKRVWNSSWPSRLIAYQSGMFGQNWISSYEERVFLTTVGALSYMGYLQADGSTWYFGGAGSVWSLVSPANVTAMLVQNGTTSWTLSFKTGEQRTFDYNTGLLTAIIDRNGNTTSIAHDSIGRVISITDPVSRHLTFTFGNASFPYLATNVASDVGVSLSYAYDSSGRLTQVTNPDATTINFAYNSQSLITSVTDSQGKILETHTYDSQGRGLTSSRANGVEAVTVSYSQ